MKTLEVDVWSDIACPWCYVGKRRLEKALEEFPHKDGVKVTWHAFELDPKAPSERDPKGSYAGRLAAKYGTSEANAQAMIDRMVGVAKGDGIEMRFDRIRSGNTFDAHRLVQLAKARGMQDAVKERLFRAHFTDGTPIGDRESIAKAAVEAGLEAREVEEVLSSDRYAAEVREDETKARQLGISGVPFFVLGNKYGISGAQPAEVLREALSQAWSELAGEPGAVT